MVRRSAAASVSDVPWSHSPRLVDQCAAQKPLKPSSRNTAMNATTLAPPLQSREALVQPMFPLPTLRRSTPFITRPVSQPKGMPPST
jgi:hypothetical protein